MERCPEIEELALQLYRAVSSADLAFFERRVARARGIVFCGTAPDEWWEDRAALLDAIRAQMAAAGPGGVTLTAGELRGWREGAAGWVADRPTLTVGGVAVACRHTSVCVREAGEWRIAQHHFSIGQTNQAAFGAAAARLQ